METHANPQPRKTRLIIITSIAAIVIVTTGGLAFWKISAKPTSLLPASLTHQVTTFTPYFFTKQIPANYTINTQYTSYENGVLMVTLTKPDGTHLVLTEQQLASDLTEKQLFQNGEPVTGALHPASINDVEDRRMGVMVASSRRTLILINGSQDVPKDDFISLLRSLQPLQK